MTGSVSVLLAGMAGTAPLAIGLGVALLGCVALLAQPFLGLATLAVFAHLDAVEKTLFGFLPVSAFKLLSGLTVLAILLNGPRLRRNIHDALREPVIVAGVCLVAIGFVSAIFAEDKAMALSSLQKLLSLLLLPFLVVVLADTPRRVALLICVLVATSVASALILGADFALGVQLFAQSDAATTARTVEGVSRSSGGSDYNPTTAASLMLVGVVVALSHAMETRQRRVLLLMAVAIGTGALILSFARSAALSFSVVALLIGWRHRHARFAVPVAGLVLLMMIAALPLIPAEYWQRLSSFFGGAADHTLGRRMTYNIIGLDLFTRNPLLGLGPGNFVHHFTDPEYRHLPGRTMLGRELHNMYLSVLVQYGLIGGAAYFAMLIAAMRHLGAVIRHPASEAMRVQAVALRFGLFAYLLVSLFLPNEYTKYSWLLPGIAAALHRCNRLAWEGA
ncbi:O-antigen ligase family protein [Paracoccus isoporae]|nr:O-antigen ligase family protein [Paracoccus isoporae]